jgi:competence protein ComGC
VRKKYYKKGFTLSELLLGAVILVFVLCVFLVEFITCIILNEANRNLTLAITHAQFIMEEIKKEDALQDIKDKINTGYWNWDTDGEFANNDLLRLPEETITVCCYDSTNNSCYTSCPDQDPLDIRIRVDWKDRGRRQRSVYLETLFTEP